MNATQGAFKELNDSDYTQMRRSLLRFKGSEQQKEFLLRVRESAAFLECFSSIPTVGTTDLDLAPHPMTEGEYKDPPSDTTRVAADAATSTLDRYSQDRSVASTGISTAPL